MDAEIKMHSVIDWMRESGLFNSVCVSLYLSLSVRVCVCVCVCVKKESWRDGVILELKEEFEERRKEVRKVSPESYGKKMLLSVWLNQVGHSNEK